MFRVFTPSYRVLVPAASCALPSFAEWAPSAAVCTPAVYWFNEEGISKLTGALDQDQLHGLKTVLDEMTDRLNDYTSFAGAPDDAESSVKFVYKTAETVAAADTTAAETETVKEGNIFTRLWQRIVNLFKF